MTTTTDNAARAYCATLVRAFPGTAVARFHGLLLAHAEPGVWAPLPKGVRRGKPKHCYGNAFRLMLDRPDLTYCEGIGSNFIQTMHAWCVDRDGRVIDPTWKPDPLLGTSPEYFGIRLRRAWVIRTTIERRQYGIHEFLLGTSPDEWRADDDRGRP
jgi:hypothetical protein